MNLHHGRVDLEEFKKRPPATRSLVACNTTDMPHVRDVSRERCNFCGAEVWLAASTAQSVPAEATVYLCCIPCMEEKFETSLARPPSEAQIADLARMSGLPVEEVRSRLNAIVEGHNRAQTFKSN